MSTTPELISLLEAVRSTVPTTEQHTHVTLGEREVKWNVDNIHLEAFWLRYCALVANEHDLVIAEKVNDEMPVFFDFHLSFVRPTDNNDDQPYLKALLYIVYHTQAAIFHTREIAINDAPQLGCLVLSYPAAIEEGKAWHTVLRLHFPYLRIPRGEWRELRHYLIGQLNSNNTIARFTDSIPINADWNHIVRDNIYNEPVTMYGSSRRRGGPKLVFQRYLAPVSAAIFEPSFDDREYDPVFNPNGPFSETLNSTLLPITNHRAFIDGIISPASFHALNKDDEWDYWLPVILSSNYYNTPTGKRRTPASDLSHSAASTDGKGTPRSADRASLEMDTGTAEELLTFIRPEKWKDYGFWLLIGKAFHTITMKRDDGLTRWITHTERLFDPDGNWRRRPGPVPIPTSDGKREGKSEEKPAVDFDLFIDDALAANQHKEERKKLFSTFPCTRQGCTDAWYEFTDTHISLKSIAFHASNRNEELVADETTGEMVPVGDAAAYNAWHQKYYLSRVEGALSVTHADVATVFYRYFWLDFVYDPDDNRWFQYRPREHHWVEIRGGIELIRFISCAEEPRNFANVWEKLRARLTKNIAESVDGKEKDQGENTNKKFGQVIMNLKRDGYIRSLISISRAYFRQERFVQLLNSNVDIVGTLNGVIEISGAICNHRPGIPEDYITMRMNGKWRTDYARHRSERGFDHPDVVTMFKWLTQVFPVRELLIYALCIFSAWLRGGNSEKIVPFMTGNGDNSKTLMMKTFEELFQVYCAKMPNSAITVQKSRASGPRPENYRLKGTHLALFEELKQTDILDESILKKGTGGDSSFERPLYGNGETIKNTAWWVVVCNNLPSFANIDKATEARVRILPYMSKWVDDAPASEEEQRRTRRFPKDIHFDRHIPRLVHALLYILVKWFPVYMAMGMKTPTIVKEHTEAYWANCNVWLQFSADNVERATNAAGEVDMAAVVSVADVFEAYKNWFRSSFPGGKPTSKQEFNRELTALWGPPDRANFWHGIRLRQIQTGGVAMIGGRAAAHPPAGAYRGV